MITNGMAATPLSRVAMQVEPAKLEFSKLLSGPGAEPAKAPAAGKKSASAQQAVSEVHSPGQPSGTTSPVSSSTSARAIDRVSAAQRSLDQVLSLARSGRTFSPAELLAMQAHVYRASQELDLAGKVVEKATSGVKQILQTQV